MFKLMKYEMRKTHYTKIILLAVTAIAQIAFLIGLYGNKEGTMLTSVLCLILLAIGGVIVMGLESIVTLHRDMNTRQSYMLFMTPNSCYKILGAKMLECGASILIAGAFFFGLGALDIALLFAKEGQLANAWEMIRDLFAHLTVNGRPIQMDPLSIAAVTFVLLSAWIAMIATAYLADVTSTALLTGKKYNGMISFLLFLVLNWAISQLIGLITGPIADNVTLLFVYGGLSLVFAAVMYVATARIMEKKLSV